MEEKSFGEMVKKVRREIGLTQDELARRVGCAPITLRKIESDDLRPSVQIAERLAMSLNIALEARAEFVRQARAERPAPLDKYVTPMPAPEEIGREDLSGRAIRGYALGERIGNGGMGAVYRAVQPLVEREVAIKIILPKFANHPDFIRRFEAEAQLVARLEHPHIVPLYDYWREPGVAYLVMRLLRGGSVQTLLESGPLSQEIILRVVDQVGAALSAAHRAGVVHRDLKPANVLLDEDENAYLADFGIAKNLSSPNSETRVDAVIGSPDYISPEQIRSEFVRPQTDIYALGVMLYELFTGSLPFHGPTPYDVMVQHLNTPLPPLAAQRSGLPKKLDAVIEHATAKEPLERYASVDQMLTDLHQALTPGPARREETSVPPAVPFNAENPYKGLNAFGEGDAQDFFGRENLTQQLLVRLGESGELSRFLAVVGPSGSGKSSVVRAGLIPALRNGGLPGSENWFIVELLPGPHPLEELESALLRVAVNPPASLLDQISQDKRGLLRAVNRCLPPDLNVDLLLVIDQFEEVFTLVEDESVRAHLLDLLVTTILDERSRVRIVLTLRADFIDRPLGYTDFGELLRQRLEVVLPMTPDELERAIAAPAARVGLRLEPRLTAAILHDLGDQPGTLPLLQYALTELFERRDGNTLTRQAYQSMGGVLGTLGRKAEEVYTGLGEAGQAAARSLFLRLVTVGEVAEDTRRRALRSELENLDVLPGAAAQSAPRLAAVLEPFGRARLLSFDRDLQTRGATVEVAHEAILREWERLRDWLRENREDMRLERQLGLAAAEWEQSARDESFLLGGTRLGQFESWAGHAPLALTPLEHAYLEASLAARERQAAAEQERRQRELETAQKLAETETARADESAAANRRLRRRAVWLGLALALTLLAAVAAVALGVQSQTLAEANLDNFLSAKAYSLVSDPSGNAELGALLSIFALKKGYNAEADVALTHALPQLLTRKIIQNSTNGGGGVAFSPDGSLLAVTLSTHQVQLYDVSSGKLLRTLGSEKTGSLNGALRVVFSPDGKLIMAGSRDGTLDIWETSSGALVQTFSLSGVYPACGAAFSPDGRSIAAASGDSDSVHILDIKTGRETQKIKVYMLIFCGLSFSPDGQYLLTSSDADGAVLWRISTGEKVRNYATGQAEANQVGAVVFSADGKQVLTANGDGTARLWDTDSARLVQTFVGHKSHASSVAFSPDGRSVLTGSWDATARLWDAATGEQKAVFSGNDNKVAEVAFSPDGHSAVTGSSDGAVRLWRIPSGGIARDDPAARFYSMAVWSADFTPDPDGRRMIFYYPYDPKDLNDVKILDTNTGKPVQNLRIDNSYGSCWSSNGQLMFFPHQDSTTRLWKANDGMFQLAPQLIFPPNSYLLDCDLSPDGRFLAIAGYNLSDLAGRGYAIKEISNERISYLGDSNGVDGSVSFSPDGKYLFTKDTSLRLWNLADQSVIRTFSYPPIKNINIDQGVMASVTS